MQSKKTAGMKKVTLYTDAKLWKRFGEICRKKDSSASRELRRYMRTVVEAEAKQTETKTPEST